MKRRLLGILALLTLIGSVASAGPSTAPAPIKPRPVFAITCGANGC